jgi:hypothetical protein
MGIVSEPWGGGKGLAGTSARNPGGERGGSGRSGKPAAAPQGRRRPARTHSTDPLRRAGSGRDGEGERCRGPHEVSRTGAGRWPGRKTSPKPAVSPVERRRCPARHTGHRVMSTPVTRSMRVATDSGAAGPGGGPAARRSRHRASVTVAVRLASLSTGSRRGPRRGGSGRSRRGGCARGKFPKSRRESSGGTPRP